MSKVFNIVINKSAEKKALKLNEYHSDTLTEVSQKSVSFVVNDEDYSKLISENDIELKFVYDYENYPIEYVVNLFFCSKPSNGYLWYGKYNISSEITFPLVAGLDTNTKILTFVGFFFTS